MANDDPAGTSRARSFPRAGPRACAWAGFAVVLGYAVFAAVQIMVLNPSAAAPGKSLAAIRDDVAAAGETLGHTYALVILTVGVTLAVAGLVFAYAAPRVRRTPVVLYYLVLLAFGTPAYFFASFNSGMSLADTYGISGGDHSPWAGILYVASGAAVLGALIIGIRSIAASLSRRDAE